MVKGYGILGILTIPFFIAIILLTVYKYGLFFKETRKYSKR
jgi:hypothetical protein